MYEKNSMAKSLKHVTISYTMRLTVKSERKMGKTTLATSNASNRLHETGQKKNYI